MSLLSKFSFFASSFPQKKTEFPIIYRITESHYPSAAQNLTADGQSKSAEFKIRLEPVVFPCPKSQNALVAIFFDVFFVPPGWLTWSECQSFLLGGGVGAQMEFAPQVAPKQNAGRDPMSPRLIFSGPPDEIFR